MSIPFNRAEAGATGAATSTAIPLGGILSGDTLLAVIEHDVSAGSIQGHDPSAFTVSDGEIESATVDTSGSKVHVIWATQ